MYQNFLQRDSASSGKMLGVRIGGQSADMFNSTISIHDLFFTLGNLYSRYCGTSSLSRCFPYAIKKRRDSLNIKLNEIYKECSVANWDGYQAVPVKKSLRKTVERFLDALPSTIPDPEISVDPDGEISLDWCSAPDKMFSISLGSKGRLSYAGLNGEKRSHGIEFFQKDIPVSLIVQLREFYF
jgi:hypothetical protein